jgi:hypothetical protein
MRYVVLIASRSDSYDRHWVTRNTLDEARKVANNYNHDLKYNTEIYEISQML